MQYVQQWRHASTVHDKHVYPGSSLGVKSTPLNPIRHQSDWIVIILYKSIQPPLLKDICGLQDWHIQWATPVGFFLNKHLHSEYSNSSSIPVLILSSFTQAGDSFQIGDLESSVPKSLFTGWSGTILHLHWQEYPRSLHFVAQLTLPMNLPRPSYRPHYSSHQHPWKKTYMHIYRTDYPNS